MTDKIENIDFKLAQEGYDLAADFYDAWKWQEFWRTNEYPLVRSSLDRHNFRLRRKLSILDVGCGTGWYLGQLHSLARGRVGIDVSQGMLAIARHRLKRNHLIHGDACSIPFSNYRFDAVICTRVLSHISRPDLALSEMRRVTAKGGILIISDVDPNHNYNYTSLPTANGKIFVETYKHERDYIYSELERLGCSRISLHIIETSGSIISIERNRDFKKSANPAGWVSVWRKTSDGADKFLHRLP